MTRSSRREPRFRGEERCRRGRTGESKLLALHPNASSPGMAVVECRQSRVCSRQGVEGFRSISQMTKASIRVDLRRLEHAMTIKTNILLKRDCLLYATS